MKNKKELVLFCVFRYIQYRKFWSISLEHIVKRNILISEQWYTYHSSEIRILCLTICSSETLQNFLYCMYRKTQKSTSSFLFFISYKPLIYEEWFIIFNGISMHIKDYHLHMLCNMNRTKLSFVNSKLDKNK